MANNRLGDHSGDIQHIGLNILTVGITSNMRPRGGVLQGYRMRSVCFAAVAVFALGGCATVDVTALGSGTASVTDSSAPNVVETATSRLFALFSSKGWSTHDSRKKMQSAASVLLNGLDAKTLSSEPSPYITAVASRDALATDIREAAYHVEQTVKAAEVFLAMSGPDQDIRTELSDLEQALLASRQAEKVFGDAQSRVGDTEDSARFGTAVNRLRDVTDEFGRRVRRANTRTVVARTGGLSL